MVGSATLTTVPSNNAMPEPRTVAAISQRAAADANGTRCVSTDSPLSGWSTASPQNYKVRLPHSRRDLYIQAQCMNIPQRRFVARTWAFVHVADVNSAPGVQAPL